MNSVVYPRLAAARLRGLLAAMPVVVVTGARQTGKSTLVTTAAGTGDRLYASLDDLDVQEAARRDPAALVRRADRLTLDEVQRAPDLLLAIKRAVDTDRPRRPGRFILTGSANLLLMHRIADSLAGRAAYLTLRPFTIGERRREARAGHWDAFLGHPPARWPEGLPKGRPAPWQRAVAESGFPTPALHLGSAPARRAWMDGYTTSYLERDLQQLSAVENLVDFRRLMRAVCLRIGNLLNQTELARDVGLSQPTVHRYLNLLEASHHLIRIPAFSVNRTRRLIKSPKAYWNDAAYALHLAGEAAPRGAHLENLVLNDLLAWADAQREQTSVLYWRTASGQDVDFVIERGKRVLPVEIKAAARPGLRDAGALNAFLDEYPDLARGGLLLHGGEETFRLSDRVLAVPWWRLLGGPTGTRN